MILANGTVVTASQNENSDLFNMAAGSCGILGIVTELKIQLIEAKKYVKLTCYRKSSIHDTVNFIIEKSDDITVDYLDSIVFSQDFAVVMVGQLSDDKSSQVQHFSQARDPWFYLHVEQQLKQ